jgi:hypothetical protein
MLIRAFAVVLMLSTLAAVVYDMVSSPAEGRARWASEGQLKAYRAELLLDQVKYNSMDRSVAANVTVIVKARPNTPPVESVVFRLARNRQGQLDLLLSESCSTVEEGEEPEVDDSGTGPLWHFKRLACGEQTLGHPLGAGERAYPFDRYRVSLFPGGCVNLRGEACVQSRQNIGFTEVTATAAHAALLPALEEGDGVLLQLARRSFIQHLALVLAAMSVVFFGLLTRVGEPKELFAKSLGFYGTLWALRSLIVPSSVSAFPTYVDYFVLTLFALAFAFVLYQLPGQPGGKA